LAVLAVVLVHATQGLSLLTLLALVLGHHRMAQVVAALAITADLVFLLQAQFAGLLLRPLDFAPVLAMAAFHRDAPPVARRPWLMALPGYYLLVPVPMLVLQATGNQAWLPDSAGLGCLVVSLFCLAHAPRALSRSRSREAAGSGVWSLALMLLAGVAGVWRPDAPAAAPPPSHLRSPIVLTAMRVKPPAPAGGCPARFTMISVPGNPGQCVRPLDTPVTITSAAVSSVSSFQPRTPSGQASGPPAYQIMITLPAADVDAATAVVTTAYDSRGGVDFSVAGRTWALPMVFRPFRTQQLSVALLSKNQALQLHRLLVPSG
jgi:hypothetical protein